MDNVHFSSASNEWETPQDLYDWLDRQYHFTHDLACTEINKKAPVAVADSLNQDWSGLGPSLWCNPPYGRELTHWVEKAERTVRHHGDITRIMMLIPARPDTNYWHDYILNSPVLAKLSFIRGRLKFTKDGQPIRDKHGRPAGAPFPSALLLFDLAPEGRDYSVIEKDRHGGWFETFI